MTQRWNVAWLGLLFVFVLGVGSGQGAVIAPSPGAPLPEIIAFVGNNVVDLRWNTAAAEGYEVTRNGAVAGCTPQVDNSAGKVFCRDEGLAAGETYAYRVEAVTGEQRTLIGEGTVTTGFVRGVLYESLSWNTPRETYSLDGQVRVTNGAVLSIGSNVGVDKWDTPSEAAGIETEGPGGLQVVSATPPTTISTIYLRLHADNDVISGAENELVVLDRVSMLLTSSSLFHYCSFDRGSVEILAVEGGVPSFTSSHFVETYISIEDTSSSVIFENDQFGPGLGDFWVHDGGKVTITESVFAGVWATALEVGTNSVAALSNNTFNITDSVGVRVWPSSGAEVTLQENTFVNSNPDVGGMTAVSGGPGTTHEHDLTYVNSTILMEDNVFLRRGLYVSLLGGIDLEARNNTFAQGGSGFRISTDQDPLDVDLGIVNIHDNCIATTIGIFLTSDSAVNVNATGNWWGAASGPYAVGNPDGGGANIVVESGNLSYANWLQDENCAVPWRNLRPTNLEAVQVVQTWDNQVPLVAGKPAVVRVYPSAHPGETEEVSGELTVMRDGAAVGTLRPQAPLTIGDVGALDAATQLERRSSRDSSLFFKVPGAWVGGSTMTFSVELNADRTYEEFDYADNILSKTFVTRQRPPVSVGIVPTDYQPVDVPPDAPSNAASLNTASPNTAPALQTILGLSDLFQKLYPADDVEVALMPTLRWPHFMSGHGMWPRYSYPAGAFVSTLGLSQMRLAAEGGVTGAAPELIYGAFSPQDWDLSSEYSMERLNTSRMVVSYGKSYEHLFANTQLSLLGMWGTPAAPQTVQPAEDICYFYDIGYDIAQDRIVGYGHDTCSVGSPKTEITDPDRYWITAEHYQRLLDAVQPAAPSAPAAEEPYVAVAANISYEGEVELLPAWQFNSATPPQNPPVGNGAYCVQLRDAAEATLSSHCFELVHTLGQYNIVWDRVLLALPVTGEPARVVFLKEGVEIGDIPVTAHAPQVTISSTPLAPEKPLGPQSTLALNWTASDADPGDELQFSILVSPDNGERWLPVTANIEETTFYLDLGEIPAGSQVLVRVEASDGYNVGHADYGPFALQNHAPQVLILSPAHLAAISPTTSLSAIAYDREDGVLDGDALRWSSDVDGDLGTGELIFPANLSAGQHTVTLRATDGDGVSATASLVINVGDEPVAPQGVYLPVMLRP